MLLRDCLAREEAESLVIGSGIPESWMEKDFKVTDLPTYFGKLSFEYDPLNKVLDVYVRNSPPGGVKSELPGDVTVRVSTVTDNYTR
jgi:hypothetical protein